MKNYVVLDIETPNTRGNSISAVGLLVVRNGNVTERICSFIDPEDRFDRYNQELTGIDKSMVTGAPTFPEFWPRIKDFLTQNVVVGHNILYSLFIIAKSLERYDMRVPSFRYLCALVLSQKYISADSYKLEKLAEKIGFEFNKHDPLEYADAVDQLFRYISKDHPSVEANVKFLNYDRDIAENLDKKLASNINDLYGIIEGVAIDGEINTEEVLTLQKWVDSNSELRVYPLFNSIILTLDAILADRRVTEYELIKLRTLVSSARKSSIYNQANIAVQVLDGILKGIVSDEHISESELVSLKKWLSDNDYLTGIFAYDKIVNIVSKTLADGMISDDERDDLVSEFNDVLNPVTEYKTLDLAKKSVCLVGEFVHISKNELEHILTEHGAVTKSGVSPKLDYIFVGSHGSEMWKYGSTEGKLAKAQELQEKGNSIRIISEDDLIKYLHI